MYILYKYIFFLENFRVSKMSMDQICEEETALGMWLCVCVCMWDQFYVCEYILGWIYEIAGIWLVLIYKNNNFL